ncbi:protein SPIRAL1-like 5 [Prosopis cineraria]|uniref:protein SPIRAL1-like 5 n=1 Tax=Prosopis cineraria TaxID=364024 RepID=UPI00240F69EC|nr:protein SPIRAL1-like 5 [Prosopis cineraria]
MSRGESYGGGQSSLGYLFGSEEQPKESSPSKTVSLPPYGTDMPSNTDQIFHNKSALSPSSSQNPQHVSDAFSRAQGHHLGTFLTDRPSTKVKSVPGGDSSLGYLFGDK